MTIAFNGTGISAINFNGLALTAVNFNGVTVWTGFPSVAFSPSSFSPVYGSSISMSLVANRQFSAEDGTDETTQVGTWLSQALVVGKTYPVVVRNVSPDSIPIRFSSGSSMGAVINTTLQVGQQVSFNAVPSSLLGSFLLYPMIDITGKTFAIEVSVGGVAGTYTIYG